jgi:hypothetical protein
MRKTGRSRRLQIDSTFSFDAIPNVSFSHGGMNAIRFDNNKTLVYFNVASRYIGSAGEDTKTDIDLVSEIFGRVKHETYFGISGSGSLDAWCDMEEWADFVDIRGTAFGAIGKIGEIQLPFNALYVKEFPKIGGQYRFELNVGGVVLLLEGTITADMATKYIELHRGYSLRMSAHLNAYGASCFITGAVMGQAVPAPPGSGLGSITLDYNNGIHVSMDHIRTIFTDVFDGGLVDYMVPTKYRLTGSVYAGEVAYPGQLKYDVADSFGDVGIVEQTAGPGIDLEIVRKHKLVQYLRGGAGGFYTFFTLYEDANWNGVRPYLTQNSLTARGEAFDQRMLAHLPRFSPITLEHLPTFEFDDCSSNAGWTNASVVGGAIQIAADVNDGVGVKTYTPPIYAESYGRMRIRMRIGSSSTLPIDLEISSGNPIGLQTKRFQLVSGPSGTWKDVDIDLLAPRGSQSDSGIQDSRFPLQDGYTAQDIPANEDPSWGINRIWKLKFKVPSAAVHLEIDSIQFVRTAEPKLNLVNSSRRFDWSTRPEDPDTYIAITGNTDGRRSLEFPGVFVDLFGSRVYTSLVTFHNEILARRVGWKSTLQPDLGQWYFSYGACFIGGNGALHNGEGVLSQWEVPLSGPTQLRSQVMVDAVIVPPECGDLASNGGYGGAFKFYIHKILRGEFTGVVYSKSRQRVAAVEVEAKEVETGNIAGREFTDVQGLYRTKDPFGRAIKAHEIRVLSTDPNVTNDPITVDAFHRHLRRVMFRIVLRSKGGITIANGHRGYLIGYASVDGLGVTRAWRAELPLDLTVIIDDDPEASEPRLVYIPEANAFAITYEKGEDVFRQITHDEGESWFPDPGEGIPYKAGVRHFRQIHLKRTAELLNLWYDPTAEGIGWEVVSEVTRKVAFTGSGVIGDETADDVSFDATYVQGETQFVDVVFAVEGERVRYRSFDDARSFFRWAL